MVALHLPGVLVEVRNGVTVTVEGTVKGVESAGDSRCSLFNRLSFVSALIIPISDRIEDEVGIIFAFLVTKIDISDKLYGLTFKGILNYFVRISVLVIYSSGYLLHTANDCTKCGKLVSVCDSKLGLGSIVPSVVKFTFPSIFGIRNESNLREGRHSNRNLARGGIIEELVVHVKL